MVAAAHGNQLLDAGVGNAGAFEGERKRAMSLAEVAGIEQRTDAEPVDVGPVEAAIQDVEAEIAVDDQIVVGGQIGGEAEDCRRLAPRRTWPRRDGAPNQIAARIRTDSGSRNFSCKLGSRSQS